MTYCLTMLLKTKLQIMAEQAIAGDQEAPDCLNLEESTVELSNTSVLTWETLCCNCNYCTHVFVLATHLNLNTLRRTSRFALQSMAWITRRHHQRELPTIATTCTVEHLANIMSMVLAHVPPSHLNKNEDFDLSSSLELEEEEPTPKKIKEKIEKKQQQQEEMVETCSHCQEGDVSQCRNQTTLLRAC